MEISLLFFPIIFVKSLIQCTARDFDEFQNRGLDRRKKGKEALRLAVPFCSVTLFGIEIGFYTYD